MITLQQTHVTVTFQFSTDKEAELVTLLQLLFSLALIVIEWTQALGRFWYETSQMTQALIELTQAIGMALSVYLNVASIIGKAIWFGVAP